MIGDIDIHIATKGNNSIYNEILSEKLGVESVSGGRNTYIYKMGIDHSDTLMFKVSLVPLGDIFSPKVK